MSTIILVFVYSLIASGWSWPTGINSTSIALDTMDVMLPNFSHATIQPNVTINLNCSCIISTPNSSGSKVIIPGLIVNGKSDYRCNQKTFNDCKHACVLKRDDPIFNIESRSVATNLTNGVNLNAYLCGLMDKDDSSTMVSITTLMDCTEKSTNFELFNSQSNSVSMSPSSTLDCPVQLLTNTTTKSTIVQPSTTVASTIS